jgi:phospholipid/cholesterol/gamma-HCH transport system substrate-binding protein
MEETKKMVAQLNAALGEARESLRKADAILADAQKISASARDATTDLGALRAEVESSLRRVSALIDEIDRKWPFARDTEVKLP